MLGLYARLGGYQERKNDLDNKVTVLRREIDIKEEVISELQDKIELLEGQNQKLKDDKLC